MNPCGLGKRWTSALATAAAFLWILWLGGGPVQSGRAAPPSSLVGSTVTPDKNHYVPGQANAYRLAVTNASTDAEFLDRVQISFPAGWVIGSLQSEAQACLWPVGFVASGVGTNQALFFDPDGPPR